MKKLALVAALGAVGCDDPASPGAVRVGWRLAGRTCESAALVRIEALLYDYSAAEPVASATADCASGVITLASVEQGRYALVLHGLEANGCTTHAARTDTVRVEAGATTRVPDLLLTRRQRTVRVTWPFGNELGCTENGVAQVAIDVRVNGLPERQVPALCRTAAVDLPDVPPGTLEVRVVAYDRAGIAVATGEVTVSEPADRCAEITPAEAVLDLCVERGC